MASKQDLRQLQAKTQPFKELGTQVGADLGVIAENINTEFESPLKMAASFPVADALLHFADSAVPAADGASKVASPVKKQLFPALAGLTINFQTQALSNAADFDVEWPVTNVVGNFRNAGFTLISSGKIKILFSDEAATESALPNAGGLFVSGGLPIGYVTLECTNAAGYFKTAGSLTNIIENTKVFRFGSGAGGGGGTGDANSFTENLKHRLVQSYFSFVTPSVFEVDEQTLIDTSTASFDIVDGVMNFTAVGQTFTTINLFCQEFLDSGDMSRVIEVHAEWFDDTSVDEDAVFEVTTDGATWFTLPMTRQGYSTKFTGSVYTTEVDNNTELLLRVTSGNAGVKLKAFGVFYDEQVGSVVTGIEALQKFTFSGSSNTTTFTISAFLPDSNNLKVYDIGTGQVYRYGAFSISGNDVVFPSGTFSVPGETIELLFDQSQGSGYDHSDANGNTLASNHLGSTISSNDKSIAGRGILIRNAAGQLREIWLDEFDNLNITNPKS